MTRREAAMVLVNMAGILRDKGNLDYSNTRQLNEAVVMACGELMVEEVLNERLKCECEAEAET